MNRCDLQPLLVITGPTGSGKSELALEVARGCPAEIVSADSMAVYRGLDIGTATPDAADRRSVPHHLISCVDPSRRWSAGDFVRAADAAIESIGRRGHLPLVVGGSHFWIEALLLGLFPAPPRATAHRRRLSALWREDPAGIHRRLRQVDPATADRIPASDRQRLVRALEHAEVTGEAVSASIARHPRSPRYRALVCAPRRDRRDVYARILRRVDAMFAAGLVGEVERLIEQGVPPDAHALKAIGYREIVGVLDGATDLPEARRTIYVATRRLAARQLARIERTASFALEWVPPAEHGGARRIAELWRRHTGRNRAHEQARQ